MEKPRWAATRLIESLVQNSVSLGVRVEPGSEGQMASPQRPSSAQSWKEGAQEQEKFVGKEMQIWKESQPMEGQSTYMAGVC